MKKLLTFKVFITPVIIKWYWYLTCISALIMGIQQIVLGANSYGYSPFSSGFNRPNVNMILQGIAILIAAPLVNRVICEVLLSIVKQPDTYNNGNTVSNTGAVKQ